MQCECSKGGGEEAEEGCTLFEFSAEDVLSCRSRAAGLEELHHSEFDRLLLSSWEKAMRDGVFRYDLTEVATRIVPGRYGIVAMNNPKRFSHRRPPADMQCLVQPFDPNQFNFNRVKPQEVLFEVCRKERQEAREVHRLKPSGVRCFGATDMVKRHMVAVNVSPIDRGHVLLVPEPTSCLPQVMTQDSLQLCLELMSLSGHSGFCMVANSLLAYASVNHLHYHFMYTAHPLLAAAVGGCCLPGSGGCYELTGHYVRGLGFQTDSDPETCASQIFQVISLLLEYGVPYNIVMVRGPPFTSPPTPSPSHHPALIRTILVPRKPVLGFKNLYQQPAGPPPFFAASCELGLGLIPILGDLVN
jgi:GDP-D-glucose phosphorylase